MKRPLSALHKRHLERHAIRMQLCGGELHMDECRIREDYVDSAEVAVKRLRAGEEIWLAQIGWLVTRVQMEMRAGL